MAKIKLSDANLASVPIPAMRGRQGGRVMYLLMPGLGTLANFFRRDVEAPAEENVQRPYNAARAADIAEYIEDNPQEFVLGALTYAIDEAGAFDEVEPGSNVGVLYLPLESSLKCIDGQHRAGGVREMLGELSGLRDQQVAIVLYVEAAVQKRRQMFSDMNANQRPVAKSINVAFDSRDPFARAARILSNRHPLLEGRVEWEQPSVRQTSDKLFTLGVVYDALGRCFVGVGGRVRNKARFTDQEIEERGRDFFDLLVEAREEYQDVIAGKQTASQLRTYSILASGPTLKVLAGAYHLARESVTRDVMVRRLSGVDFRPASREWTLIGFTSEGKNTPNSRLQEMKAATSILAGHLRVDRTQLVAG